MMENFRTHLLATTSKGRQLIETKQYEEAVKTYRSSLNFIKATMLQLQADGHDLSSQVGTKSIPQLRFAQLSDSPITVASEESLLLYQNPLEILPEESYTYDQVCFVLIYNLALSYHLCATSCLGNDKKASSLFKTAMELWEIVYRLQCREDMGVRDAHTCAILNNLGHLCQVVGHTERSRQCFTALLATMHSLEGSCDRDFLSGYETFMNSVMYLISKESTIAPAA